VLFLEGKKRNDNKNFKLSVVKQDRNYTKLLMSFRADIEIMKHIKYFNFKVPVNNK
jgi:hypothetical protein